MPTRRSGNPTAFWNNVAVGANGTSTIVHIARDMEQIALFISVNGATTVSLEAAHFGSLTSAGNEPDASTPPAGANFFPVYYINTPCQIVFAGAGTAVIIVPDFEVEWIRLRSSAAVTITAGYEVTGE